MRTRTFCRPHHSVCRPHHCLANSRTFHLDFQDQLILQDFPCPGNFTNTIPGPSGGVGTRFTVVCYSYLHTSQCCVGMSCMQWSATVESRCHLVTTFHMSERHRPMRPGHCGIWLTLRMNRSRLRCGSFVMMMWSLQYASLI